MLLSLVGLASSLKLTYADLMLRAAIESPSDIHNSRWQMYLWIRPATISQSQHLAHTLSPLSGWCGPSTAIRFIMERWNASHLVGKCVWVFPRSHVFYSHSDHSILVFLETCFYLQYIPWPNEFINFEQVNHPIRKGFKENECPLGVI